MRPFILLLEILEYASASRDGVNALKRYISQLDDEDRIHAIALLTGRKPRRMVPAAHILSWSMELIDIPGWLFEECSQVTGELPETLSLLIPHREHVSERRLSEWMNMVYALDKQSEEEQYAWFVQHIPEADPAGRLFILRLISGRAGLKISLPVIVTALSELSGLDEKILAKRLSVEWTPYTLTYAELIRPEERSDRLSMPYPFHPVITDTHAFQNTNEERWLLEWKWDGLRAQVVYREGHVHIWSETGELLSNKFPELISMASAWPEGTVLDGEVLAHRGGHPLPLTMLQARIKRKYVTAKIQTETPVLFNAFDMPEHQGQPLHAHSLEERRVLLETLVRATAQPALLLSTLVPFTSAKDLDKMLALSRLERARGVLIKKAGSGYADPGAHWIFHKAGALSLHAVLLYAQKGTDELFSHYTLGVWNGKQLVTVAKAEAELGMEELLEVDDFIRRNTLEKFGPVRTVRPELVFEISVESIHESRRHKSGIVLHTVKILAWKKDKKAREADTLASLKRNIL